MSQSAEARMGVSDVRANMTEVLAEVRLLGRPVVLTRREKPQAVLVPHGFYEQALRDRALLARLYEQSDPPLSVVDESPADVLQRARIVGEALRSAERDIDAARTIAES
jgi:prevent-host-death family protein